METLGQLGIPVRKEWTVLELRSIISEQKEEPNHNELKGLSSMKLDQLLAKAREAGIEIPTKPTRGLLMRLIRDSVPGAVWPVQGIPLWQGALKLLGLGNHGDSHERQQLPGPDPVGTLGQREQVPEDRGHLEIQVAGLQGPGIDCVECTSPCGTTSQIGYPRGQALKTGTSSRYPKTKSKTAPRKKTRTLSSSEDEDFSMIEDTNNAQKIEVLEKTVKALQDQLAASSQKPTGQQ